MLRRPARCPTPTSATLPEVFPDFAPGNFTWDDDLAAWVWTTFNDYQWDLNWANPDVLCEFADIILGLANLGVEVFRLDAIAFLWKRLGTNCQNQPEVHDLTQALRTVARIAAPGRALQGRGDRRPGRPPGLPRRRRARRQGQRPRLPQRPDGAGLVDAGLPATCRLATHALQRLPQPPSTTAWITYAALPRRHRLGDRRRGRRRRRGSPATRHRRFLSDWYSGDFPGSWARGLVFQQNEATGDRRISGSLASLAGLEAGDPDAVARILLAHAIILGFGGLPVIWMGDELGPAQRPRAGPTTRPTPPTTAGCTGRGCRGRVAAATTRTASAPACAHLLGVRRALPHLHAAVAHRDLGPARPGRAARRPPAPVGPTARRLQRHRGPARGPLRGDGLAGARRDDRRRPPVRRRPRGPPGNVVLPPYAARWVTGP